MKKLTVVNNRAVANSYKTLVAKISNELSEMEAIVRRRTAEAYWRIGKFIDDHLLEHKDRAGYGAELYIKLSKDTDLDISTLQRAVQFYRAYPNSADQRNLSWDHYKKLITIKDVNERKKIEETAARKEWSTTKLGKYLNVKRRLTALSGNDKPVMQLSFTRGRVNVYAVEQGRIDFGFKAHFYPEALGLLRLPKSDYIEIPQEETTVLKEASLNNDELYTYSASILKIIDGDTLDVDLTLGFGFFIEQRLRLRGIDSPEIDTDEGKKAKRFVEARLKDCKTIIVKTYKDRSDKFDRYLADIFYLPGEDGPAKIASDGLFLNQELLDEHLAIVYE